MELELELHWLCQINNEEIKVKVHAKTTSILRVHSINSAPHTWFDEIMKYILHDALPDYKIKARQIQKRVARYIVHDNVLYRRSFTKLLLRCISPALTSVILEELHGGICSGHPRTQAVLERIINQGYYWPTLRNDAEKYVKRWESCQKFSNIPRKPSV